MSKRYSHFLGIVISQFVLGILMLAQTLYYMEPEGVPFRIVVAIDAGLMTSGIISLIMGIQKHRKHVIPKEEKDIWE